MNTKLLTCFAIILLILAGAVSWVMQHRLSHDRLSSKGDTLLKALPLSEIASITIIAKEEKAVLANKTGRWVVENRFDYAADFIKITDLINQLTSARIGHRFPIREDIRNRLKLNLPTLSRLSGSDQGIQVLIKNQTGDILADILFGKPRRLDGTGIPDSRYVIHNKMPEVYLVDSPFAILESTPSVWLDLPVIEAEAKAVRKIECFPSRAQTPTHVFERLTAGKALLPILQPDQTSLDESVVRQLEWAITYLPMEDVLSPSVDPATIGVMESIRLDYTLFDGTVYRVFPCNPCSKTVPCYVKIEADYQKPDEAPSQVMNTLRNLPEETMLKVQVMNSKLGSWIYKISEGHHSSLIIDLD